MKNCPKCGMQLNDTDAFCMACGFPQDEMGTENTDVTISLATNNLSVSHKKRIVFGVAIMVVVICALLGALFIIRGPSVSDVLMNEESIAMRVGEGHTIVCTILPEKVKNKTLEWVSSNPSVAKVDENGKVTAILEGACSITATAKNGKTDTCEIIVTKAKPNLKAIYASLGGLHCDIATDGSCLTVDTNPYNIDGYFDSEAYNMIEKIIARLGLPESLRYEMEKTRAIDGRMSKDFEDISVSWSYHPDNGLEVSFSVK